MPRPLDPDTWVPPALPESPDPSRIRGAMYGTRLYDQPAHADFAARVRGFCAPGPPLAMEVGVDRGYRLLGHARRWPETRWLGVEVRKTVLDAADSAPDNALLIRGDARAVLAALVPEGRLARLDILFPTPSDDPKKLLLTPAFAVLVASRLAPGAVLHLATDVPGLATLAERAFGTWPAAPAPESGPVQSRREKACAREGRRVWRWTWGPPPTGAPPTGARPSASAR
jgi:tRNA G46 methylase TrmB